MSRFQQRLRANLRDPEFAEAFYDMSAGIARFQKPERASRPSMWAKKRWSSGWRSRYNP